jgi:hypothetical protein
VRGRDGTFWLYLFVWFSEDLVVVCLSGCVRVGVLIFSFISMRHVCGGAAVMSVDCLQ